MPTVAAPAEAGAQALKRMLRKGVPALACLALLAAPALAASTAPVHVLEVAGAVDPAVSRYVADGLAAAADAGAQMVLIRLDTPGGLLEATRDIVQSFLNTPVPVVLYVAPRGARATSAGVFLMMAADVSAMAPETHIGAAHPVSLGGGAQKSTAAAGGDVMAEKAVSDASAYIRALALERGRNAAWAERAVRESVSLTADEAYAQEVVDLVAEDEAELFDQVQGGEVEKGGRTFVLNPVGAPRVAVPMPAPLKALHVLANPNLAYVLLMIGVYALLYEFSTPGVGFGGVTGILCLVAAFFALQVLPLNTAGLILLVAGLAMMALDHAVGGHGFLMTGGAIAFAAGSFMLYDRAEPFFRVSLALIGGSVAAAALFSAFVLKAAWGARRLPPSTGREALVGLTAEMREDGLVFADGKLWTADGYGPFAPGEKVRIFDVQGNTLKIEKL
jgi:membrane-bound serine protease (ClpP class)